MDKTSVCDEANTKQLGQHNDSLDLFFDVWTMAMETKSTSRFYLRRRENGSCFLSAVFMPNPETGKDLTEAEYLRRATFQIINNGVSDSRVMVVCERYGGVE